MNTDTLSRYRLLERIGAGGMGEVWKAHDPRLDRIVAVKMLLRGALGPLGHDTGHERFRREALTLSRLSHAGIATVFDFHSEGDQQFLVMEFVPGGTLESRLREVIGDRGVVVRRDGTVTLAVAPDRDLAERLAGS